MNFEYSVYEPRLYCMNPERRFLALYNAWKDNWGAEFSSIWGRDIVLNSDMFTKYSYVVSLCEGDRVVGGHCYGLYNVRSVIFADSAYAEAIGGTESVELLRTRCLANVMSMEQFFIDEQYKGTRKNVFISAAMISLGILFLLNRTNAEGIVTLTRDSRGAGRFALKRGFSLLRDDVDYCGEKSSLMFVSRQRCCELAQSYDAVIAKLWAEARGREVLDG